MFFYYQYILKRQFFLPFFRNIWCMIVSLDNADKTNPVLFHQVLSVIKALCSMNACRHELEPITAGGFQSRARGHAAYRSNYNTPPKIMRGSGGYRGAVSNNESYSGGDGFSGNRSGGGYRGGYGSRGYSMGGLRGRGNWNSGGGFRGRY